MAACIDLTGMKFGRSIVIERAGKTKQANNRRKRRWYKKPKEKSNEETDG